MKAIRVLLIKELRDSVRDRRSLFFALLYGPILLPLLLIGPLLLNAAQLGGGADRVHPLPTIGAGQAPNLQQTLRRQQFDVVEAPQDALEQLARGELRLVLEIPPHYAEDLRQGRPAQLILHYDGSNDRASLLRRQVADALERHAEQTRILRYLARGIDPAVFQPLALDQRDISDEPQGLQFIAYMVPFLLLLSMMMGGFYLAVDTTAGERERRSLEPLLGLPLPRHALVLGKYLAILLFVLLAMILPLISAFILFGLLPEDMLDGAIDFGPRTFALAFWSTLPLAFLLTAFLMAIATLARNTREAQTHLSLAMLLPMLPFFGLQFLDIGRDAWTMLVPMLSQYQLMELAVTGREIPGHWLLLSAGGSLAGAALLLALTVVLYRREKILV